MDTKLITEAQSNTIKVVREFCESDTLQFDIANVEQYQNCLTLIVKLKDYKKEIEADKTAAKDRPWRECCQIEDDYRDVIKAVKSKIQFMDNAGRAYDREVKRVAAELQRLEDQKAADERKRKEDAAQRELDKAAKLREEGRDDLAENAEARAEVKQEAADSTVAQIVTPPTPKNVRGGFNLKAKWAARVTNAKALLCHVLNTNQYNLCPADMKLLNALARTTKGPSNIPGVEFYEE